MLAIGIKNQMECQPCPICGSEHLQDAFKVEEYSILRCMQCGHCFVGNRMEGEVLEASYGESYYEGDCGYTNYLANMEKRAKGFKARLDSIEHYVEKRGRLLDIGCAVGIFVKVAKDAGWDAKGYERSAWAVDYGRTTLGVDITHGSGQDDVFQDEYFDVITFWDALEHVENPKGMIALASRWLRPGGLLALNTVNGSSFGARLAGKQWRHLAPPHHLQFYTRSSLKYLLTHSGFDVLDTRVEGVCFSARREPGGPTKVMNTAENIVTYWRARWLATKLNLLDEIYMLAVKR